MGIFGKAQAATIMAPTLARRIAAGAELPELIQEAVEVLLADAAVDRAAVWMESPDSPDGHGGSAGVFRGKVAERGGEATPTEWKRLSVEAPIVQELLSRGDTAEFELDGAPDMLSMGALVEMRRAVCAPVQAYGTLRGVVFAGARRRQARLEPRLVESLAAELAIAAQLEDERRHASERQEDVVSATRMLNVLGDSAAADSMLAKLVDDCTKNTGDRWGLQAVFASIAVVQGEFRGKSPDDEREEPGARNARADVSVKFLWHSGDASWTGVMEHEPLSGLWRQAMESRRIAESEPGTSNSGEVKRIVALPLEVNGELLGVMVAGLRRTQHAFPATLERMELRTAIAVQALLLRKRHREAEQQREWDEALLESGDALVLLESNGQIRKLSQKARCWLGMNHESRNDSQRRPHLVEFFQTAQRSHINAWMKAEAKAATETNTIEAGLKSGTKVRLQRLLGRKGTVCAVALRALEESTAARQEHRAEAELRNVLEWLEEGVVLFDEQQEIRLMNSRFAQIAGLTPDESMGTRNLQGLVAKLANQTTEPEKFALRWLGMAHGNESGVRDEVQLLRPAPRVLERTARPVLDAEGRRLGRVEIYRDLTAQRVFHSKLIQTEKLAALGQMVTTIAHELSNPLTSILGYAQRLLARSEASGSLNEAQQILRESERASNILKQLLLTARNSRPERRKVALNEIITRTIELQEFSLRAEKVRIELDLDAALPAVLGDPGQLQQVLMNLIGNARQALEQEGKSGTIRIRTRPGGGTHAIVEVSDDGPGIPQAILAKIFDPFFTTKPAGIGTGLGLSVVLGIVRDHGGQVRASSPPGGGATFSIELPAVPGEHIQSAPPRWQSHHEISKEAPPDPVAFAGGRGESVLGPWARSRVLVVEDEATVAQLIADVLKDEGLDVEVLLDGREALRQAATSEYELVICDMKMPDLDGEQFYRRLAQTGKALSQRVLFVTGDVLGAHTRQFLEQNALAHLAKPFRVEELTEKVHQILTGTRPRQLRAAKTKVARH